MQEIFKDISNYEGIYQVSDHGRVKSLKRYDARNHLIKERILKPAVNSGGYYVVVLCNGKPKTYRIHQLEAIAFLNHKPCGYKLVVDHKDFDRLNNHLPNLRLITVRKNTNKKHLKSSSEYVGVYWHKKAKKWMAQISLNGKTKYIGYFTNELEASIAYQIELKKISK
jgi:hypothetical protein